jgi:hypothetical protein
VDGAKLADSLRKNAQTLREQAEAEFGLEIVDFSYTDNLGAVYW